MDGILKILVAVVTALDAATGAPVEVMPDRPPIMAPTLAPLPMPALDAETRAREPKATSISGTITNIQDGFVFVNGMPVLVGPATQVKGQLRAGQAVQVQAKLRADGVLEADELELDEKSDLPSSTPQPTEQTQKNSADEPKATPTLMQEPRPLDSEARPTEELKPKATEKPEVKPTEKPEAHPTEKARTEPTERPEVRPTAKPSYDNDKTTQGGTSIQRDGEDSDRDRNSDGNNDSGEDGEDNHSEED